MKKESRFLRFQVNSARRSKSGLTVSGIIKQGHVEVGDRVFLYHNSEYSECYVNSIWQNGKNVRDCHQGKASILSLISSSPIDSLADEDLRNTFILGNKLESQSRKNEEFPKAPLNNERENNAKIQGYASVATNNGNNPSGLSVAEKEYLKNLRIAITNCGFISPTEVYVLDKIRVSLGLDSEKVEKLAEEYISRMPSDTAESQYYEAVAVCLLDRNYVSDSERMLLRNLRMYLGISEERAAKIEKLADWDNFS